MAWQRARQPAQKEHRRATILAAAARLFDDRGFERITLSAVATAAKISKSDLYRYFESKEEIFLHLLRDDLYAWVSGVEQALAPLAGRGTPETVTRAMTDHLSRCPRLPALASVAGVVLEQNVSADVVAWFKAAVLEITVRAANALHAALPGLSVERARQVLLIIFALITGLWHFAHPAPAVEAVLERPGLRALKVDFDRELGAATVLLLRGILAGAGAS
jgi:AcrR family transcriptional regulator